MGTTAHSVSIHEVSNDSYDTLTLISTEIYLYSGRQGSSVSQQANVLSDEMFILSLPAFVWFKVNYTPTDPRIFHTCHVVGNRQLISVGGLNPSLPNVSVAWNNTDPYAEGLKVFDMTTLQWTQYYNASAAPYVPSDPVMAHYESKSRYPLKWDDPELEKLFILPTSNSTNSATTSSTTPGSSTSIHARQSNTGTIAGGIVAGVIGVAVIIFGAWRLCHRKPKIKSAAGAGAEPEPGPAISQTCSQDQAGNFAGSGHPPAYEVEAGLPHEAEARRNTGPRIELDATEEYELDIGPRF